MSVITVAEINVAFRATTDDFDRKNLSVQTGLRKTAIVAEETSESLLHMAAAASFSGSALEAASVQGVTYNRVTLDASKASQILSGSLADATKMAVSLESGLDVTTVAARSAAASFGLADKAAVDMGIAAAAAKVEVQGLGRAFGSNSATAYAGKLDAGSLAASALRHEVTLTNAQVAALNQQLGQAKSTGFPLPQRGVAGGPGSGLASKSISMARNVGSGLTTSVTAPLLAVDALSLKVATDFDAAMAKVEGLGGVSTKEAKVWSDAILAMGPEIGKSPRELADALLYVASEGQRGAKALETLRYAGMDSATGMGKTADIARAIVFAMHDYASSNLTAAQASDVLVAATRVGNFQVDALSKSLGRVLPVAANMKVPFDQTAAAIASITRAGAPVTQAVTDVVRVMATFEKPTVATAKALDAMKLNAASVRVEMQNDLLGALLRVQDASKGNSEQFAKVFGSAKAFSGTLALLGGNLKETRANFDSVAKSAGASADANAKGAQSMARENAKTEASLESMGIAIGRDLMPVLKEVEGDVRDVTKAFMLLDPQTRSNIVRWSLYAAALGPVISGGAKVAGGIKDIIMLRSAYTAAQAAMAAANAATGASATAATAATGGLAASVGGLIALAATPIVFTVIMAKIAQDFTNQADEARAANTKGYSALHYQTVQRARGILRTGGQKALLDAVNTPPNINNYLENKPAQPTISKADALQAEQDEKNARMYGQYQASRDASQTKYEAQNDAAAKRVAEAARLAALATGSGLPPKRTRGGRSGGAGSQTDPLDFYREESYQLAKSAALVGDSSKSASLGYDIAHKHLDGYNDALKEGKNALANNILEAAKHNLNLTYTQERAEKSAKAQEDVKDAIQKAQEAANQATQNAKDAGAAEIPAKSRNDYIHEAARQSFGKGFASLTDPKAKDAVLQAAAAAQEIDRIAWAKETAEVAKQFADNRDDAVKKGADRIASVAQKRAEDLAKQATQYQDLLNKLNDKRDEGNAATSLSARRAQYVKEQSGSLDSTGDLAKDLERQASVAAATGQAFDATPVRAFRDEMRQLTREWGDLKGQTDAARFAAIRFDADGLERMSVSSARTVLDLQKLIEQERKFREQARQVGDAAGTALSDGMNAAMQNGVKSGIQAFFASINKAIQQAVIGGAARGLSSWVTRSIDARDPNRPKAAGDVQGGVFGAVGAAAKTVFGGGKDAALGANTRALTLLNLTLAKGALTGGIGAATSLAGLLTTPGGKGTLGTALAQGIGAMHFATGGHYEAGVPRITSEKGSELDIPDHSGNIFPADLTQRVMNMAKDNGSSGNAGNGQQAVSGGDTHVHNHFNPMFNISGPVDRRSTEQIARESFRMGQMSASSG